MASPGPTVYCRGCGRAIAMLPGTKYHHDATTSHAYRLGSGAVTMCRQRVHVNVGVETEQWQRLVWASTEMWDL